MTRHLVVSWALLVALGGCATSPSAVPIEPAPGGAAESGLGTRPPPLPGGKVWDELSKDERKEVMKTVVIPRMQAAFRGLDAERYAQVRCVLCHGEGAKRDKFSMPNPELPKLGFADHFAKERAEKPRMVEFMAKTVVPEMAAIVGAKPFDPATGKGFGCRECHTARD